MAVTIRAGNGQPPGSAGPVTYAFDQVSITTLKVTTSAGEAAARQVADALQVIPVQAAGDEADCEVSPGTDIPAGTVLDVTCVAPRGRAYLAYAQDARGRSVQVTADEPVPGPISGATRAELTACLASWRAAALGPSADAEHDAAAALAAAAAALLEPCPEPGTTPGTALTPQAAASRKATGRAARGPAPAAPPPGPAPARPGRGDDPPGIG